MNENSRNTHSNSSKNFHIQYDFLVPKIPSIDLVYSPSHSTTTHVISQMLLLISESPYEQGITVLSHSTEPSVSQHHFA